MAKAVIAKRCRKKETVTETAESTDIDKASDYIAAFNPDDVFKIKVAI